MEKVIVSACPLLIALAVGCGGVTPPPAEPPVPPPPEAAEPLAPGAEPKQQAESDRPKADESKEASKSPGGPMAIYDNPTGPVTVGFDGAVVRSGRAELRIPPGALTSPRNIVFMVDRNSRGHTGKIGDVYSLEVQVPNEQYEVGDARRSNPEPTGGNPFQLKLPLPAGRDSANLAVESVAVNEKGRGKSTWIVIAMTKPESADTGNRAVFELANLPDAHVHLTTLAASQ